MRKGPSHQDRDLGWACYFFYMGTIAAPSRHHLRRGIGAAGVSCRPQVVSSFAEDSVQQVYHGFGSVETADECRDSTPHVIASRATALLGMRDGEHSKDVGLIGAMDERRQFRGQRLLSVHRVAWAFGSLFQSRRLPYRIPPARSGMFHQTKHADKRSTFVVTWMAQFGRNKIRKWANGCPAYRLGLGTMHSSP